VSRGGGGGRPLRVGLLGYGIAGRVFHAPLIAASPDLALAAVVTTSAARRAQVRAEHPDAAALEHADRLWERAGDLDLVVVATPNRHHAAHALAALDAGLPVVVDKPLAPTAAQAQLLIEAARRRRLPLTVFQNRRWDGDFLTVRRLVRDGALGTVHRFESRFELWQPEVSAGWREEGAPEEAGGLLYDLGSHLIDQALHLFGPVTSSHGEIDRRRAGVAVDDDVFVALEHGSGVRSHLWMSVLAAIGGPRMRLLGMRAAYEKFGLDVQERALGEGSRPDDPAWGREPPDRWGRLGIGDDTSSVETEPGAYPEFYRGVAASLRTGSPPPVDPNDSVAMLEIIEAALESARTARVIALG
jgi:predicted dehydrogenase